MCWFCEWRIHTKLSVCASYILMWMHFLPCTLLFLILAKIFSHRWLCSPLCISYYEASYTVIEGVIYGDQSYFYNGIISMPQIIMRSKGRNRLSFLIKRKAFLKFLVLITRKSISSKFTSYYFTSTGFNLIHNVHISN